MSVLFRSIFFGYMHLNDFFYIFLGLNRIVSGGPPCPALTISVGRSKVLGPTPQVFSPPRLFFVGFYRVDLNGAEMYVCHPYSSLSSLFFSYASMFDTCMTLI